MSIEPERIPAALDSYRPRLLEDLEHTFGDLVPPPERDALVDTMLTGIQRSGPLCGGTFEQMANWIGAQVRQRVIERLLSQQRPPAFTPESEQLLACLLHERHPEAMTLLSAYAPRLEKHLAIKYPRFSPEEREDMVRDGLLRVFEKGPEFNPALSKLTTWLTTHVTYRALDELRLTVSPGDIERLADDLVDERGPPGGLGDEQPSPEMMAFIRRLSPQRARAIIMHYYEGMSFEAIARTLKTREVTVRAHLSRARKDLEQMMGTHVTTVRRVVPILLALIVFVASEAICKQVVQAPDLAPSATSIPSPVVAVLHSRDAAPSAMPVAAGLPGAVSSPSSPTSRAAGELDAAPFPMLVATSSPEAASPTSSPTSRAAGELDAAPLAMPVGSSSPEAASPTLLPTLTASPDDGARQDLPLPLLDTTTMPTATASATLTASGELDATPPATLAATSSPEAALATTTPSATLTASGEFDATPLPTLGATNSPEVASPTSTPTLPASGELDAPLLPTLGATSSPEAASPTSTPTLTPTLTPSATATPSATLVATSSPEASAAPAICLYGIHDGGDGAVQLVAIDLQAGTALAHGSVWQGSDIRDIAFHPQTGALYAASGDEGDQAGALFLVDLPSGELHMIGSSGESVISALAFNPADGTLWGWAEGEGLVRFDLTNGAATLAYPSPVEIEGMTWSADGSSLYAVAERDLWVYANSVLHLKASNLPGITQAIGLDGEGRLLGTFHEDSAFTLYTYDFAAQEVVVSTSIATPYEDIDALAWLPSCRVAGP